MALTIIAYNISTGGGKVLLDQLIGCLRNEQDVEIWIDERNSVGIPATLKVHRVKPTIKGRISAEIQISKSSASNKTFFFFGNLPPLFLLHPSTKVFIYLQNKYILEPGLFNDYSLFSRFRSLYERLWFKFRYKKSYTYLVQTIHMKEKFLSMFAEGKCRVTPFFDFNDQKKEKKGDGFIYVASPDSHKNHVFLIEAMRILALEGIKPRLRLIFDQTQNPWLVKLISDTNQKSLTRIEAIGPVNRSEVMKYYSDSACLIFPSTLESFGLPLLEAKMMGLDIVASELDYVRELVDPDQSFDPHSSKSIAGAIRRYLGVPSTKLEILSSQEFLKLLNKL